LSGAMNYDEFTQQLRRAEACQHEEKGLRKRKNKADVFQVLYQCSECGAQIGQPVSQRDIDVRILPEWDDKLEKQSAAELRLKAAEAWKVEKGRQVEQKLARYDDYIRSANWRKRADKALKRDQYVCQACGDARATEVHHLTYERLYEEPLFDLVSVCHDCHTKLHPEGRRSLRNLFDLKTVAADA
jgi:hypothetical protein